MQLIYPQPALSWKPLLLLSMIWYGVKATAARNGLKSPGGPQFCTTIW